VPEPAGPVGPIKHVVVISLATPGYEQSFGAASQMPYLSTDLVPKGQLVPGYSLLDSNPLPNNVALISGQRPNTSTRGGCTVYASFPTSSKLDKRGLVPGSGCIYPVEALTLADQIGAGHMAWRGYIEDMADESGPHNCVQPQPDEPDEPAPGGYAARLNPFVYFHSLLDIGDCATNDLPIEQLTRDLSKPKTTPQFAFVAPNLCHSGLANQCPAGAPAGAAASDAFLAEWVPKILKSKAISREGLVVILPNGLDSPEAAATPAPGADPLKVGALLLSRYVTAGGTRDGDFTPYSLLRTVEDLFALTPLAEAGSRKTTSLGSDLLGPQY
jgi:hypothetical protein